MDETSMTIYDNKGDIANIFFDPAYVYQRLSEQLIAKKINKCLYIKSIKREQLYTGFINITVRLDNGYKIVYHIKE